MDSIVYRLKRQKWLSEVETIANTRWTITKATEPDSVAITASVKKTIIDGDFTLSQTVCVRSITNDEENSIQTAVLAVNSKLVSIIQDDSNL